MIIVIDENIYDMDLISKIKERTGSKKLKKITKYLRNLAEDEIKEFSELKIKKIEDKKEDLKKIEVNNSISDIEFQNYIGDYKKLKSKSILNNGEEYEGENDPSTVDGNDEEMEQIDNSFLSDDE